MMLSRRNLLVFLWLAESSVGVSGILRGMEHHQPQEKRRLVQLVAYNKMNTPDELGLCEGKCKKDEDCAEGLICFQRDAFELVPQCEGGDLDDSKNDYCIYDITAQTDNSTPNEPSGTPSDSPTRSPVTTESPVKQRLLQYVLQGGAEFEDPGSYQSKALARTEEQMGIATMTDAKIVQYYALYCLYTATNKRPNASTDNDPRFIGIEFPEWKSADNWEETNVDPCSGWHGIECENDQVTAIDLYSNDLTGAFPPEVMLFASDGDYSTGAGNLNRIDLFQNEFLFNEDLDNSWMTHLGSNFEYLYLQYTSVAGHLPKLPQNLVELDCSWSLIDGGLTDENFEGLNKLNYVDLDGNAFNSSVPSVFRHLQNLEYLYLADSFISGDLSYMEGMPKIIEHWIDKNPELSGPIFPFIGDLDTLQSFSASRNSLTGELPSEIGNLSNMVQFWCYDNMLSGPIPTELGMLARTKIIELEKNFFTGFMPANLCVNMNFFGALEVLGADCEDDDGIVCDCCTCCSLEECQPFLID